MHWLLFDFDWSWSGPPGSVWGLSGQLCQAGNQLRKTGRFPTQGEPYHADLPRILLAGMACRVGARFKMKVPPGLPRLSRLETRTKEFTKWPRDRVWKLRPGAKALLSFQLAAPVVPAQKASQGPLIEGLVQGRLFDETRKVANYTCQG